MLSNVHRKARGLLWLLLFCSLVGWGVAWGDQSDPTFKILHIMSYHSPWPWTDDQLLGFKHGLGQINTGYKTVQLDAKRQSSQSDLQDAALKARQMVDTWKPDLVYVSDDAAQKYVTRYYINSDIPFVFSGVNTNPIQYGFLGSRNITGVMEQEHFVETVKLLKRIVPKVKKIAVIFDEGPTWEGVGGRMLAELPRLPDISVTNWNIVRSFDEYQQLIQRLQTEVDAIALLGIFTYKDELGGHVPYTEVLRWTAENSRLPDFSFWKDRISYGTLCSVTVSGYEQGLEAGKLARQILVDHKSPSQLTMRPSVKGEPVISLARAKKLGIQIPAEILLSSEIITDVAWKN